MEVGVVTIKVRPDLDGFRERIEAEVRKLRPVKIKVHGDLDTADINRQAAQAVKRASGKKVKYDLVESSNTAYNIKKVLNNLQGEVSKHPVEVVLKLKKQVGTAKDISAAAANQEFLDAISHKADQAKSKVSALGDKLKQVMKTAVPEDGVLFTKAQEARTRTTTKLLEKIQPKLDGFRKKADGLREYSDRLVQASRLAVRLHEEQDNQVTEGHAERLRKELHQEQAALNKIVKLRKKRGKPIDNIDDLQKARDIYREIRVGDVNVDKLREAATLLRKFRKDIGEIESSPVMGKDGSWDSLDTLDRRIKKTRELNKFQKVYRDFSKRAAPLVLTASIKGEMLKQSTVTNLRKVNDHIKDLRSTLRDKSLSGKQTFNELWQNLRQTRKEADGAANSVDKATKKVKKGPKTPGKVKHQGRTFLGLTRMGWIISAVAALTAPAVGLVSGALAALPSLGYAAGAALGVAVLGFKGIKDAAKAAAPALDEVKEAVSDRFRDRLTPQFEQLGETLKSLSPALVRVADGMSDFTQGAVDAVAKGKGFENTRKVIEATGELFSDLKPFSRNITLAMAELGATGARTFKKLSSGLNKWSQVLNDTTAAMAKDGRLVRAIEATYSVLGRFGDNFGKLVKSGIEHMPSMERAANRLFDGFGDGVTKLIPGLTGLFNGAAEAIGELFFQIGNLGEKLDLGPKFEAIGAGLSSAVKGAGEFLTAIAPVVSTVADLGADLVKFTGEKVGNFLSDVSNTIKNEGPSLEENSKKISEAFDRIAEANGKEQKTKKPKTGKNSFIVATKEAYADIATIIDEGSKNWAHVKPQFDKDMAEMRESWSRLGTEPFKLLKEKAGQTAKDWYSYSGLEEGVNFVKRKIKETADLQKSGKSFNTKVTGVGIGAGLGEGIETGFSQKWDAFKSGLSEKFSTGFEDAKAGIGSTWDGISEAWSTKWDEISASMSEKWASFKESAATGWEETKTSMSTMWDGLVEGWSTSWDGIKTSLTAKWDEIKAGASTGWEEMKTSLGTVWDGITEAWNGAWSGVQGTLSGIWNSIKSEASSTFSSIGAEVSNAWSTVQAATSSAWESAKATVSSAWSEMVSTIQAKCAEAVSVAQQMPGQIQSALGNLGSMLFSSGQALIQGFINGIRSMIGAVASAAGEVVAAARAFFPFSPAKKGPFSGRGYTTWSGKALATDFAKGMLSERAQVATAAGDLVGGARAAFEDLPQLMKQAMEGFNSVFETNAREKVEAPIRAANAKKIKQAIEQYDKQVENAYKNHDKKMKEWNGKGEQPELKLPEFKIPELETPDYSKIDRSFKAYYVDGLKEILNKRFSQIVLNSDIAGKAKAAALDAVSQVRRVIGDHGILQMIENNVNDPKFGDRVRKAIEEAKIGEIPVNFAVANIDQLKNDLGMGDGVVSRALDALMKFNPNESDANQSSWDAKAEESKPEIHYHVLSIEEAMRLEDVRRRREAMKLG